jgi:branched-chain amino acid transport system permease protein
MAVSVVVAYRGSGIINLAIGGISMVSAYAFWALKTGFLNVTMGTVPAFITAVAAAVAVGVIAQLLVFRPLRTSSPLAQRIRCLLGYC